MLDSIKGYIGQKINGVSFNIDLVNACCLSCNSCGIGSIGNIRGGKKMSFDLWTAILDKAQSECKVRKIQLYAYSDPCLVPDLHIFVEDARKRKIPTLISTMLQTTRCDFAKVIEARPHEFRISFPGLGKMEYYQKGAKVETFNKKFKEIMKLPRYPETLWTLVFHLYSDNADEIPVVRLLAEEYNLKLVIIPAIFMVCEKVIEKNYSEQDKELISHLLETPEESISRMKKSNYCMQFKQITLDANGDVFLCQLVFEDRFKLMNYLDHPLSHIQKAIRTNSFCNKCMKEGGNVYQACYDDFKPGNDPVGDANKKRHKTWEQEPVLH